MQGADLIIINGIGFEDWINDFELINSDAKIIDTSKSITIIDNNDSHIWLNPVFAKIQVENISYSLIQIDPANQKYYKENTDAYINKLNELDEKISQQLSQCRKDFVAFHNAFSYFAIQYGLNQHTIINSNEPYDEPTSGTLESIINLAKKLNVTIIFAEEAANTRTSQVIADEINGKVLILSPLEIGDSEDYIAKMEKNLSNLKEALCT